MNKVEFKKLLKKTFEIEGYKYRFADILSTTTIKKEWVFRMRNGCEIYPVLLSYCFEFLEQRDEWFNTVKEGFYAEADGDFVVLDEEVQKNLYSTLNLLCGINNYRWYDMKYINYLDLVNLNITFNDDSNFIVRNTEPFDFFKQRDKFIADVVFLIAKCYGIDLVNTADEAQPEIKQPSVEASTVEPSYTQPTESAQAEQVETIAQPTSPTLTKELLYDNYFNLVNGDNLYRFHFSEIHYTRAESKHLFNGHIVVAAVDLGEQKVGQHDVDDFLDGLLKYTKALEKIAIEYAPMETSANLTASALLQIASTKGWNTREVADKAIFRSSNHDECYMVQEVCSMYYKKHNSCLNAICENSTFVSFYNSVRKGATSITFVPLFEYYERWKMAVTGKKRKTKKNHPASLAAVIAHCINRLG
jgi:hypothetical protein